MSMETRKQSSFKSFPTESGCCQYFWYCIVGFVIFCTNESPPHWLICCVSQLGKPHVSILGVRLEFCREGGRHYGPTGRIIKNLKCYSTQFCLNMQCPHWGLLYVLVRADPTINVLCQTSSHNQYIMPLKLKTHQSLCAKDERIFTNRCLL